MQARSEWSKPEIHQKMQYLATVHDSSDREHLLTLDRPRLLIIQLVGTRYLVYKIKGIYRHGTGRSMQNYLQQNSY